MVVVYGLEKCGKCDAAKSKLKMFETAYQEKSYAEYVKYHEGWKSDNSVDVLTAKCFYGDTAVPIIQDGQDFYDYPGFMKKLKQSK